MPRGLSVHQSFEQINGSPKYLGTIQSTGANVISNLSSGIRKGDRLLVQPDAPGYVLPGDHATAPSTVNSATTGVLLSAAEKFYVGLSADAAPHVQNGEGFIQWISFTGTTNLKVWRME